MILNNLACTNLVWSSVDFIAPTKCSLSRAKSIMLGTGCSLNLSELKTSQRKVMSYLIFNSFLARLCVPFSVTGYDISYLDMICLLQGSSVSWLLQEGSTMAINTHTTTLVYISLTFLQLSPRGCFFQKDLSIDNEAKDLYTFRSAQQLQRPTQLKTFSTTKEWNGVGKEFLNSSGHFSAQI